MDRNVSGNEMPAKDVSDYLDRIEKSVGSNRDADGLGTMAAGLIVASGKNISSQTGRRVTTWRAA